MLCQLENTYSKRKKRRKQNKEKFKTELSRVSGTNSTKYTANKKHRKGNAMQNFPHRGGCHHQTRENETHFIFIVILQIRNPIHIMLGMVMSFPIVTRKNVRNAMDDEAVTAQHVGKNHLHTIEQQSVSLGHGDIESKPFLVGPDQGSVPDLCKLGPDGGRFWFWTGVWGCEVEASVEEVGGGEDGEFGVMKDGGGVEVEVADGDGGGGDGEGVVGEECGDAGAEGEGGEAVEGEGVGEEVAAEEGERKVVREAFEGGVGGGKDGEGVVWLEGLIG